MRRRAALVLAVAALGGCDEPVRAVTAAPPREVGPSPLVGADPDRLRVILYFANYVGGCGEYFKTPTDPRYIDRGLRCEGASLDQVDWLRANGFPTVQVEHVRAPEFFESQRAMDAQIVRCREAALAPDGSAAWNQARLCDPVVRLAEREHVTRPEFAGIVAPR
jgi:hypothetical protein